MTSGEHQKTTRLCLLDINATPQTRAVARAVAPPLHSPRSKRGPLCAARGRGVRAARPQLRGARAALLDAHQLVHPPLDLLALHLLHEPARPTYLYRLDTVGAADAEVQRPHRLRRVTRARLDLTRHRLAPGRHTYARAD